MMTAMRTIARAATLTSDLRQRCPKRQQQQQQQRTAVVQRPWPAAHSSGIPTYPCGGSYDTKREPPQAAATPRKSLTTALRHCRSRATRAPYCCFLYPRLRATAAAPCTCCRRPWHIVVAAWRHLRNRCPSLPCSSSFKALTVPAAAAAAAAAAEAALAAPAAAPAAAAAPCTLR
eukprot:TRINITY_DN114_c0_g3_i3.p1 TRINITY_DN114_c0_g3~~TRINITY_DN114_c0_g3_i3.p1  ORF type:complete len:175 (+),score=46.43 TRINITY_DN114_c0_g3_i3:645-1169(+)